MAKAIFVLCSVSLVVLLPTTHAASIEAVKSAINWEYGGWRPILPGSPFFFVKTNRASAARDVSLEGQASSISAIKVPPPSRSDADLKSEALKAEASEQETSSDMRASSSRQVPLGLPPVGGIPGCCDFQPVLYIKQQPGLALGHEASQVEAQFAKPRPNLTPDYQAHEPVPASETSDLDHGGSQIIHGTPIGDERPQLPHQLFHGGHEQVHEQAAAQTTGGHHDVGITSEQASVLAHTAGTGHSNAILNVLNKLPSFPPALNGNVMSLLSGLQGHALPPHIQNLVHQVHSTGNIPSNIPPELAHMIGSFMRGNSHHQGGGGKDQESPRQPHPTAPPFYPRPDKNIFTWYPRPQTTPATPLKPIYNDGFPKPHKHLHGAQLVHHSHHHDGGSPVPVAVVHGPVIEGEPVQLPPPGPIQSVFDGGHGHHVHQEVVEAEIIHSDSQQNIVTARPQHATHKESQSDQQAQHSQQRPPLFRPLPQHRPLQDLHRPVQGGHRVRFPQIQEHRINAEIVRGRPETDYDPSQPPRIHVEEVPPDVLATGIHPSGHPIRVDGINLNIIAPSPVTSHATQHGTHHGTQDTTEHGTPLETHRGTETQQQAPQDDRYDHYHRPEDVPGSSEEEHGEGYQSESQRESSIQPQYNEYKTDDHVEQGHVHQGYEEQSHVEPGPAYQGHVEQGHLEQGHVELGPAYQGHVEQGHLEQGHAQPGPAYQGHVEQGHLERGHVQSGPAYQRQAEQGHLERGHVQPGPVYQGHVAQGHLERGHAQQDYLQQNHVQHGQSEQYHGQSQDDYQDGDYAGETLENAQEHSTEPPPAEDKGSHEKGKGQRGAIHFHPIATEKVEEDEPPPQLYHAYYAPAQHKPPPGYVRMTVDEFNKIFKDAEIQFIGSDTDLSKKLEEKVQTKLQVAQTGDSDTQESSIKIETIPTSEEQTSIRTSVSVSTSTSSSDGKNYPAIQPRHANKDIATGDVGRTSPSTEKPSKVSKKSEGSKDKVKSVPNLFGARIKAPRKLRQQSRTTTQATNE